MKVSVVVINWNGAHKLQRFLPEILKVRDIDEVIVTDDASSDNSVEVVTKEFPQVRVIRRDQNGGFSSNANTGVNEAKGELVFLLNPDAVPDIDCVTKALTYFKDPTVFSVGCNTGGNWSWARWDNGFLWHYMAQGSPETHQTLWARGGSGIFRKSIYQELNGMDELFNPFYEEDFDLGYRATKRGYKNMWVKECKVQLPEDKGVIAENVSKSKFTRIAQRNQLYFIWKNITDPHLISTHKKALIKMVCTHPSYWGILFSAVSKLSPILEKREIEKKALMVKDIEILEMFGISG